MIAWEEDGVAVDVPPDVVPWKYIVPPDPPLALMVVLPQYVPPPLTVVTAGVAFTVTTVVYTVPGLQPGNAVPLVTVREYVLVMVGVAVGLATAAEDRLGPLHEYALALPPGLALKVTDDPEHIGLVFVGAAVGTAFTLMVTPLVVEQPAAVAVTLYTLAPVAAGVIVELAHEVQDNPLAPDMPAHV